MRTLVLGGARSGKSTHAEQLVMGAAAVDYVATSAVNPDDAEWVERIALHQARRPGHWRTLETADIASVLRTAPGLSGEPVEPVVLVDCLGVWITRMMDECGIWEEDPAPAGQPTSPPGQPTSPVAAPTSPVAEPVEAPRQRLQRRIDELVTAVEQTRREVVFVSNEVGQGVVPAHWSGRFFRDQLGILNTRVASACERVVFCTAGIPMTLKDVS